MSQLSAFGLGDKLKTQGKIQNIGIVGCGSVGQEICLLVARSGLDVAFVDVSEERLKEIFASLEASLDDVIRHWGLTTSEKRLVLSRIKGSTAIESLSHCEVVIETISSRRSGTMLEQRKELFKQIEGVVSDDTIISSNLSTLMISDLANILRKPDRAIGLHFLEPVDKTHIVEVVKGAESSDEAFEKVSRFCQLISKKVISIHESPGNISTRMTISIINEACEILMEGVSCVQDIDETVREATGHHVGPFELADKVGLDKVLKYMDNLYAEFGDKKYKASPVIKRLVRAKYLGRVVGKGFYSYENGKPVGTTITFVNID